MWPPFSLSCYPSPFSELPLWILKWNNRLKRILSFFNVANNERILTSGVWVHLQLKLCLFRVFMYTRAFNIHVVNHLISKFYPYKSVINVTNFSISFYNTLKKDMQQCWKNFCNLSEFNLHSSVMVETDFIFWSLWIFCCQGYDNIFIKVLKYQL